MTGQRQEATPELIGQALSHISPDCGHNERARLAMAIYSELGEHGKDIWMDWAGARSKPDLVEDRSTWRSARAVNRVRIGTLFGVAKDNGFRFPDAGERAAAPDPEKLAAARERKEAERLRAEAEYRERADRAARDARELWSDAQPATLDGAPYLARKGLAHAHGARMLRDGTLLVPMLSIVDGQLLNVQRISDEKRFLPGGRKSELASLIGVESLDMLGQAGLVLLAEGFATAASVHEATGLPALVGFDAGNLAKVAAAVRQRWPALPLVVCADDDRQTAERSGKNPGRDGAMAAVRAANTATGLAAMVLPADLPEGGTDFNDLHQAAGLDHVEALIMPVVSALLAEAAESTAAAAPADEPPAWAVEPVPADEGAAVAAPSRLKGGRGGDLMDVLLERFSLVYCDEVTAWDHVKRLFIKIPSMRTVFGREPVNQWLGSSNRHMVDLVDMVFEPGQTVPDHQINMFTGLEVQPIPCTADEVRPMLDLLRHLCAESAKNADEIDEIVHWILRWCALPLQQLGTKLQTAIVMHGPQGTGKNLFFDLMRDCYGEYGTTVGQTELEDKYNGWVSRKLFIVADEVVSRQEMFHKKNALKSLVTQEKKFPIRDMHKATRWESNHANLAFTSNESMPLALEDGDRRYMVIYTPLAADDELYQRVRDFKANGGLGKWLHYLQQYDLDGFDAHTKPIMTTAKEELIKTGWRASQRFAHDWMDGYLDLPVWPCSVEQLYAAFQRWCERSGERWPPSKETFGTEVARWAKETVQRDPMTGRRADPRIEKRVVSYSLADGQRKSLRMWIPAGRMPPEGRAWGEWSLECVEAFQRPLDRYRSGRAGLQGDDE